MYLIINNSLDNSLSVELPKAAEFYTLSDENLRASDILLNGNKLTENNDIIPEHKNTTAAVLAPATCTFIVL